MQLVNENKRTIYKVCYMYASGEDHLKDLYQEVLANLWQGIDSFRGEAKACLLYTSPSPRDISGSRLPSSA